MSESDRMEPPPSYPVDIFDKEFDSNDDIFASAIDDSNKILPNPLAELPTLQLSMQQEKAQPPTPVEESLSDEIGLESPPSPVPKCQSTTKSEDGESRDRFLEIKVQPGQRIGDGMGAYMTYKVDTKTNIPLFKRSSFSVHRRFSDFLGLHEKLIEKYLRSGRIIPPTPEKSVIGMTKIKMSGQNEQGTSSFEFIERRRAALERYLQRTADHAVLGTDPDFRDFLQLESDLPKATNTSALSGAGVMRLFNKVGETVNKITGKQDENDPWFEEKCQEIDCLESGLRKLHSSFEGIVIARKDLAGYTGSFANACALVGNCEEHNPSLRNCLVHLRDTEEKIMGLHNDQANTDFAVVCEPIKDYIALIGAIKDVFHERVKVRQNWHHSQSSLNKKKELKGKMDIGNKPDKANAAAKEIVEWESKVERCYEEYSKISDMIKTEIESFEKNRIKDFKEIFIKYLEDQMKHQLQLIKFWEAFLPEAKSIT